MTSRSVRLFVICSYSTNVMKSRKKIFALVPATWIERHSVPCPVLTVLRRDEETRFDQTEFMFRSRNGIPGLSEQIPAYLFQDRHFAPDGNTIVCVAARDAVASIYGGGGLYDGNGLNTVFGGYCVFQENETGVFFLGVWGRRNASRFRSALRRGGVFFEIAREPPAARLVLFSTTSIRPKKSIVGECSTLPARVQDQQSQRPP